MAPPKHRTRREQEMRDRARERALRSPRNLSMLEGIARRREAEATRQTRERIGQAVTALKVGMGVAVVFGALYVLAWMLALARTIH